MLIAGADGGTNAASNVVPELMRKLYDLARAGQMDPAMDLQRKIMELFDLMLYQFEFPDGFRAGVEMRGFNFGRSRQPQTPSQQADRARLKDMLQCLVSGTGLTAPPAGGCPVPSASVVARQGEELEQVVFGVLDILRQKGIL
jgi:4-hydroxy-tetrahydrodipicolinate synthase